MLEAAMIVDDSETDRYILKRYLARAQVARRILEFESGQEALEYLLSQAPDAAELDRSRVLVLLDVNMPRMDGFEFLEELSRSVAEGRIPERRAAVAMLTSSTRDLDRERAFSFSTVFDYLTKPIDLEGLQRAAQAALA